MPPDYRRASVSMRPWRAYSTNRRGDGCRDGGVGNVRADRGGAADRTVDDEHAAKALHAFGESGEAVPGLGGRAAAAVVGDPEVEPVPRLPHVAGRRHEADAPRLGMLRGVREQLCGDEIDVAFDRGRHRGIRWKVDLDGDRHRAASGERLQADRETAVLQDRRGEPARERAQFVERLAGLVAGFADQFASLLGIAFELALDRREIHLQPHEPLLRAVVDVALEPAQRRVLGLHGGAARRRELGDLALERLGPPRAERAAGDHVVQQGEPAEDERQRRQEDEPDDELEDRLAEQRVDVPRVAGEQEVDHDVVQPEVVRVAPVGNRAVPDPGGRAAECHRGPGDRDAPRDDAHDRVDDHAVQQVEPVVAVDERRPHRAPEALVAVAALPDGTSDPGPARPLQPHQLERSEAARHVERRDDDEDADDDRDEPQAREERRREHDERDDRDRHGEDEEGELARHGRPQRPVAAALRRRVVGRRLSECRVSAHGGFPQSWSHADPARRRRTAPSSPGPRATAGGSGTCTACRHRRSRRSA